MEIYSWINGVYDFLGFILVIRSAVTDAMAHFLYSFVSSDYIGFLTEYVPRAL